MGTTDAFDVDFASWHRSGVSTSDGQTLTMDCPLGDETYTCKSSLAGPDGAYVVDYVCPGIVPACVYWSETEMKWSGAGCEVLNYTATNVTCGCSHLTDFAITSNTSLPSSSASFTQLPTSSPTFSAQPTAAPIAVPIPSPTAVPIPSPTSYPTISSAPTVTSDSGGGGGGSSDSGMGIGVIIGIAVGGVFFIVLVAVGVKMASGKKGYQVQPEGAAGADAFRDVPVNAVAPE